MDQWRALGNSRVRPITIRDWINLIAVGRSRGADQARLKFPQLQSGGVVCTQINTQKEREIESLGLCSLQHQVTR